MQHVRGESTGRRPMNSRRLVAAALSGAGLMGRKSKILIFTAFGTAGLLGPMIAFAAPHQKGVDAENARHAQTMPDEGRKTSRYDTFGREALWGDALQLHKAIAGANTGALAPGRSPKAPL